MSKVMTFNAKNNPHIRVKMIWPLQKNSLSTELDESVFLLSNFSIYFPSLSIEFHHLKPTNSLPEIFLMTQKSKAPKMTTKIKTRTVGRKTGKIR